MKTKYLVNRILKAALLIVITASISYGQSLTYVKKKSVKRIYNCKHVGIQKIQARKFSKKQVSRLNVKKGIAVYRIVQDTVKPKELNTELYASVFKAEIKLIEESYISEEAMPLPQPVYFRFDTDELTHEDIDQIVLAIEHIKKGKAIILEGHTDSHGSHAYNLALSKRRVNKIKSMMIELGGVSGEFISIKYFGEEKPAIANDTEEKRQLNRRVEFVVL